MSHITYRRAENLRRVDAGVDTPCGLLCWTQTRGHEFCSDQCLHRSKTWFVFVQNAQVQQRGEWPPPIPLQMQVAVGIAENEDAELIFCDWTHVADDPMRIKVVTADGCLLFHVVINRFATGQELREKVADVLCLHPKVVELGLEPHEWMLSSTLSLWAQTVDDASVVWLRRIGLCGL